MGIGYEGGEAVSGRGLLVMGGVIAALVVAGAGITVVGKATSPHEADAPRPSERPPAAVAPSVSPAIGAAALEQLLEREEAWAAGHKFSTLGLLMVPYKGAQAEAKWQAIVTSVEGLAPTKRAAGICATIFATPVILQHDLAARDELRDDFNGISHPPANTTPEGSGLGAVGDCTGIFRAYVKRHPDVIINVVGGVAG